MVKFNSNLYIYVVFLVGFGAINYSTKTLLNFDIIDFINKHTFNMDEIKIVVSLIIGVLAIILLLDRDFYLPFLGKTVMPSKFIKENNNISDDMLSINIEHPTAEKVLYWAAKEKDGTQYPDETYVTAYGDYSNYGVSTFVNGIATMHVKCPRSYQVTNFFITRQLKPHIHYRFIYKDGMMSEINTYNLEENICK
jgi:hypothetical protein